MDIRIDWKQAKELVETGELQIIGSNLGQINNQGEFLISKDNTRLYKRRHTANRLTFDLIAKK
jgi:hypothetical protein